MSFLLRMKLKQGKVMKRFLFLLIPFFFASALSLVAYYFPLPVAVNSDFRVLYYTNKALTQGIDIYDHAAKTELVAHEEGITIEQVSAFPQFVYPPWFALSTFYLGYFPIHVAATLWFDINLSMLMLSVWLLTDDWNVKKRLLSFLFVFIFIPVFGTLIIGQYDFPVLLGAVLLNHAIKRENPLQSALGIFLLTFKPHLGGLLILACICHFIFRRDNFGIQSLKMITLFALISFFTSFLADSAWFINYFNSLIGYRALSHITTCSECANLSIWLAKWVTGEMSLSTASKIASVLLIILLIGIIRIKPPLWKFPTLLINSIIFVTIIASPYLYNYNFLLLLFPILWLAGEPLNLVEQVILAICSVAPTIALGLFGRDGNIVFLAVTLVVFSIMIKRKHFILTSASETRAFS